MATRTYLQIVEEVADLLSLRQSGTLTASAAGTVTAANYPFKTQRTGVGSGVWEGSELYVTSGTAPVPNPVVVDAYAPTTGVFTVDPDYTTNPGSTATFDLYLHGVRIADIRTAVNRALRNLVYPSITPLSLVVDADMENSGVTDWTATTATLTKVTSAGNVTYGNQALRVLATAANGQARSTLINVDPTYGSLYYLRADVRADVGTARLIAYDNTNSANITTMDWTSQGWGALDFWFTLPSTCESLAIILRSVANADDTYWDNVLLLPSDATDIPLPSWVIRPGQIRRVQNDLSNERRVDRHHFAEPFWWDVRPNPANANAMFNVVMRPGVHGPVWIEAARGYPALSVDADTTFCDREWLTMAGAVELLQMLKNRPGQNTVKWAAMYSEFRRELKRMNASLMPERLLRTQFSAPF